MHLTERQVDRYRHDGYLVVDELFDPEEVEHLRLAFGRDCAVPGPQRLFEDDGDHLRAVYASHQRQAEFAALVRMPRLLTPAHELLGTDVYVYQFKVNTKSPFTGSGWSWHQDFLAWRLADNLQRPALVNVAVFLDDLTEFNGPVIFVPGSHRDGLVRTMGPDGSATHLDPDDIKLTPRQVGSLVADHGMVSPKGRAGSVVFFHPEVVHGSAENMSPAARRLLFVTYNDVRNTPRPVGEPRPDYLVGRDTTPLRTVAEAVTA